MLMSLQVVGDKRAGTRPAATITRGLGPCSDRREKRMTNYQAQEVKTSKIGE
jgi:hypothetical protein